MVILIDGIYDADGDAGENNDDDNCNNAPDDDVDNSNDNDNDNDNDERGWNSDNSNSHSFVITDTPINNRAFREQRKWNTMYERLVAYKQEHKSTLVPSKFSPDRCLGHWVFGQRNSYKTQKLSVVRINQLNVIGFVWDPANTAWNTMYERLVDYKQEHKHTCVPHRDKSDPQFARWVALQRQNYTNGIIFFNANRINRLNSINFIWKINRTRSSYMKNIRTI